MMNGPNKDAIIKAAHSVQSREGTVSNVRRLRVMGECDHNQCLLPMVEVTFASGRVVVVHDDGSWDGHPAWSTGDDTASAESPL